MNKVDQISLLHLMETGTISETKIKKTRQIELTSCVFATANNCEKIIESLLSRFVVLQVPEYTFGEFAQIAVFRLRKENVGPKLASIIVDKVWFELGSKDIRDVIKLGRLADNEQEISYIIRMMRQNQISSQKLILDSKQV